MTDPLRAISHAFQAALGKAFGAAEAATDSLLHRSAHADYQADVAMALAKRVGRPPREVAASIIEHLDAGDVCAKLEVAGPGFINVHLRDDFLAHNLTVAAREPELRIAPAVAPETVVVDYSSPNVAKEMHVGHLRSTIIGDSLARVLAAVGHRVIRQNHIGDWGTPFGMLIEHLLDVGGAGGEVSIADLDAFYREARAKFDSDSAFAERSRARVVRLQGGDEATLKLWRRLVAESMRYFAAIYRRLDITLDDTDIAGESFYNPILADVVTELERTGIAVEDAGAICAVLPGFTGKGGSALPLIVRKQDGGYNYAATDLAALRHRVNTLGARRLLYVVGAAQAQHLAMVFATARQADWLPPHVRAEHVAFGSVLGPDKKPFKSRGGESIKLMALLEEAEARASAVVREKNPELDAASIEAIAHAVGIGSIKYADLSSHRIKDYVFDWDRMLALEGNTAPYLMYAHARIRSILRRVDDWSPGKASIVLQDPAERALALELVQCEPIVQEVAGSLEPQRLCSYLYGLASAFAVFYRNCPVLRADTKEQRRSRLLLCHQVARVLAHHLGLLGIAAPERM
jgi:arginyl-tRNA synthetase